MSMMCVLIRTHDVPKNRAFIYVCAAYSVLITVSPVMVDCAVTVLLRE